MGPYFKKHKTYDPPETEHPNKLYMPIAARDEFHGTDGPIHTSFNDYYEVIIRANACPPMWLTWHSRSKRISVPLHMRLVARRVHSLMHGLETTWGSTPRLLP